MIIDYFFGYRCPIWLLSSAQGCWWVLLGLISHRWQAKWWKIDQVLSILVVECGVNMICYVCFLHKTYVRPIHLYPTTLTVSAVPSDNKMDLILSWICWNLYYTAFKRSVLEIKSFGYLQEECCATVYLFIYSSTSDHVVLTICWIIRRCLRSPILILQLSELVNDWLQDVHFQYIIPDYYEKETEREREIRRHN